MRKYLTSFLIALSFVVAELHCFWINDTRVQNWILQRPTPMTIGWNVKHASDQLIWILVALSLLFYRPNRHNRTTVKVFVLWTIFDTCVYFVNFKTAGYGAMYLWLIAAWVIIFYGKRIGEYIYKTLHHST